MRRACILYSQPKVVESDRNIDTYSSYIFSHLNLRLLISTCQTATAASVFPASRYKTYVYIMYLFSLRCKRMCQKSVSNWKYLYQHCWIVSLFVPRWISVWLQSWKMHWWELTSIYSYIFFLIIFKFTRVQYFHRLSLLFLFVSLLSFIY
jgi:hypothetical protein